MTTPFPSPTEPLWFSIAGPIATWDPFERWLRFGERNLWVAGLTPGVRVTAIGHRENGTARWIVTQLTVD